MSALRVLMVTQKVDLDDDILGFTHTWVNKLAERLNWLHVLALSVGRYELRDNITLYSMGKERGIGRLRRFLNFNRIVAPLLLRRRVDVVLIHMCPRYAILAASYTKLMRVPMVMWFTHRSVNNELRIAHWLVDKVVTAAEESFRLKSDKVVITGHGIDTDRFKPHDVRREDNAMVILSVGRISPIKDYETMIKAADILVNRNEVQNVRFVIVGGVPLRAQEQYFARLKEMIADLGLIQHFQFAGAIPYDEVALYYQNCVLTVNMCPTGGADKAVLESMACGKPAVVCNKTFAPVFGGDAPNLLFEERNASDLAKRIFAVLQLDEKTRRTLGCRLRERVVKMHSVDELMGRICEVLEEAIGASARKGNG